MHGRPRKSLTGEEENEYSKKAAKLRTLQYQFLKFHHEKNYSEEALKLNADLLEKNPEFMTAWNYRKLAVEHKIDASFKDELKVQWIKMLHVSLRSKQTERALRNNPKSYGAWYHRKWVLNKVYPSIDVKRELDSLGVVLLQDSRNFHAWNHRRFVTGLEKKSDEEELDFTTEVIGANFSNYSAWHNRSVLLLQLFKRRVEGFFPKENKLKEEYEFVHGALFTDPEDQSGWFYHLWLINETFKFDNPCLVSTWPHQSSNLHVSGNNGLHNKTKKMISWEDRNFRNCERYHFHESSESGAFDQLMKVRKAILTKEIGCFRELLLEEENCKIGKLTLARLLTTQNKNSPNETSESVLSEVRDLYNDLISSDAPHSQYYKDERSKVLLKQLTSNSGSLSSRCYQYRESIAADIDSYVCLRLNNLSLSRLGSCKRLLWVQMLDLSHNQLCSIEGLELMQLLSCLNLSYNKIRSFSALEPIKQLKALKALNISNNEIGAHPVDTTRYLCSSPFSHTVASDWNLSEFANNQNSDVANNYWGAYSVFKDLKLTQLDILGNAVVDDEFKLFLVKVTSTLTWLDGIEV